LNIYAYKIKFEDVHFEQHPILEWSFNSKNQIY